MNNIHHSQTPVPGQGFRNFIHVDCTNIAKRFDVVNVFSNKLYIDKILMRNQNRTRIITSMHREAKVGSRRCSKLITSRFPAAGLLFFGAAGFLNGSAPDAFAHWWQR